MIINSGQLAALKLKAVDKFESEVLLHIRQFYPNHWITIGEAQLLKVIRYARTACRKYGFVTRRNICLYLNSMLVWGSNFDDDIQYPWAKAILQKPGVNPTIRINELSSSSLAEFNRLAGPKQIHLNRVMTYVLKHSNEILTTLQNDIDDYPAFLAGLFPQKYAAIGAPQVKNMMENGRHFAARYGINGAGALSVYYTLMYFMGSKFDQDPQYPWAAAILSSGQTAQEKTALLYNSAIAHLAKFNHSDIIS